MNKIKLFFNKIRHSYYDIIKVLVFMIALFIVVWQMPRTAKFKYEYQKLRPWQHESLYAPFNFPIYKTDDQLKAEKDAILKDFHPIFNFDTKVTKSAKSLMLNNFDLQWHGSEEDREINRYILEKIYDTIENKGIIAHTDVLNNKKPEFLIDVVRDRVVKTKPLSDFYTMKTATDAVTEIMSYSELNIDKTLINELLLGSLCQNVLYAKELTEQSEDQALSMISLTFGMVQKDELIISEGEVVTDDKYMIINSLQREYDSISSNNFFNRNYQFYGQLFIVLLIFIVLFFTLYLFCPNVVKELKSINMILVMMLLIIIPSFVILKFSPDLIYLMPVTILTMLLMTFFDASVAMVVQVLTLIIISLAVPNPFYFFIIELLVSMVSVFSMVKRSSRTNYFRTSFVVFVSYVVAYFGMTLIFEGSFENLKLSSLGIYALNALFTMLTLPLVFLFERIFGFVTDLTLLELSNSNTPLLRKLASEAPGTFQHVMQVADLCEEALYAIGGNMLLARTGAMYHDMGKIKRPFYFIENQNGKYNPNDDVSYIESAQIIISHVIDGIEICRKYHIPEQVIDFVRTHHGTRRTEYFYRMELRNNPDEDFNESDFHYHGPVPFSKETAVLMMADAVEAASRSMKDRTEESINKLVDNIIDAQIADNQFINTDITFRDITNVKKVFKKKMMSIYHVRIAYPD